MNTMLELNAWAPWQEAFKNYEHLTSLDSPGEDRHWRTFWSSTLSALKTVRYVLESKDQPKSNWHARVIDDFIKEIGKHPNHHPIYWEFVCNERDNLIHEFITAVSAHTVTTHEIGLTFQESVAKYGAYKILAWGKEKEDGLELIEKALSWWEINLRIIEQAIREKERFPFSTNAAKQKSFIEASYKYIPEFK